MSVDNPTRLFDFIHRQHEKYPIKNALVTKAGDEWFEVSTADYLNMASKISRALIAKGIQPQDKVALISSTNRYEWNMMDIGTLQAGAVDVPVYPNISSDDYKYIFNDSEVKLCFVSDKELYDKVAAIMDDVPSLTEIYTFDEIEGLKDWKEFMALGEGDEHQKELEERMEKIDKHDLATLIYTSGTTGEPKGVMLSHWNIASNVLNVDDRIPVAPGAKALSFLPVCHIYERMLTYLYSNNGVPVYFAESIEKVGDNIREIQPEIFTCVPRLLEKVYDRIIAKGEELTGIKRKLFFWAVALGEEFDFRGKSAWYKFKLSIARKLIFSKWQEALGGNVQAMVSGGAALNPKLNRVFSAAGFNVQEGYGLTETSPVISVSGYTVEGKYVGTTGKPIKNVELKIAEDGEICIKGPNVMMGYYQKPDKTAEVIDEEGWFHTGDIGTMVNGKYLKITDRKKEIFKTSGGKYIAPQIMENKFKESRFVEQIMVIGEAEKHPAALVQPDFVFLKSWCERKGIPCDTQAEMVNNEQVVERVMKDIDKINQNFGNWEQVKKIELTPDLWSVDDGHLTAKLSLKRRNIIKIYAQQYQKIYGHEPK